LDLVHDVLAKEEGRGRQEEGRHRKRRENKIIACDINKIIACDIMHEAWHLLRFFVLGVGLLDTRAVGFNVKVPSLQHRLVLKGGDNNHL